MTIDQLLKDINPQYDDNLNTYFDNMIVVNDKYYKMKVEGSIVDLHSIDIIAYLKAITECFEYDKKKIAEKYAEKFIELPNTITLPEGTTLYEGYLSIDAVYSPNSIIIYDKKYKITSEMPAIDICILCTIYTNMETKELIIEPHRCIDKRTKERFIHYHSLSEHDCSPTFVTSNAKLYETVQSIKESLNIINNGSLANNYDDLDERLPDIDEITHGELEDWV